MRFTKNNIYGTTQLSPHTIILHTLSQKHGAKTIIKQLKKIMLFRISVVTQLWRSLFYFIARQTVRRKPFNAIPSVKLSRIYRAATAIIHC